MSSRNLTSEVVLVAGATGELGSLIARGLHAQGARLVLCGRNLDRLEALAAELDGTTPSRLDFLEAPTVTASVELALAEFGRLDGVVNAAGNVAFGPLSETDRDVLVRLLTVDLLGPLDLISQSLPHLDGGFVVNITGVVAEQALGNMVAYSAAKAGLSHGSVALKRELRRRKVTVLDARPPHTETGLASRSISGSAPEMPIGLEPETVASKIVAAIIAGNTELDSQSFVDGDQSARVPA